jgi:hypothetical protein
MSSNYTELKGVPDLTGSINTIVSSQYHLRRPPSLSESSAWDPENIQRAAKAVAVMETIEEVRIVVPPPPISYESAFINAVLRLSFHITLISIFESIFFFFYVSSLEDAGINNTIGGFINNAISACINFTPSERDIVNDILALFLNATTIINTGAATFSSRQYTNRILVNQSWVYAGGFGGFFVCSLIYVYARRKNVIIKWKSLFLENFAMVFLLATYEYMFFSTIIQKYAPISGDEIAANAVRELQHSCGLLEYK